MSTVPDMSSPEFFQPELPIEFPRPAYPHDHEGYVALLADTAEAKLLLDRLCEMFLTARDTETEDRMLTAICTGFSMLRVAEAYYKAYLRTEAEVR